MALVGELVPSAVTFSIGSFWVSAVSCFCNIRPTSEGRSPVKSTSRVGSTSLPKGRLSVTNQGSLQAGIFLIASTSAKTSCSADLGRSSNEECGSQTLMQLELAVHWEVMGLWISLTRTGLQISLYCHMHACSLYGTPAPTQARFGCQANFWPYRPPISKSWYVITGVGQKKSRNHIYIYISAVSEKLKEDIK